MERIEIEHSTAVFLVETDDYATATATATDDNYDDDDDDDDDEKTRQTTSMKSAADRDGMPP